MTIPKDALPVSVDPVSISVDGPGADPKFAGTPLRAVFDLEPQGLTFNTPATLTFGLDVEAALPVIFLVSEDEIELPPTSFYVDPQTGRVAVSVAISHFSTVIASRGNIGLEITNPGDQPINAPFDVTLAISRITELHAPAQYQSLGHPRDELLSSISDALQIVETYGPVTVEPGSLYGQRLSPRFVVPEARVLIEDERFSVTRTFKCGSAGQTRIEFAARASQSFSLTFVAFDFVGRSFEQYITVGSQPFMCLEPASPPRPTATASWSPPPMTLEEFLASLEGEYDIERRFAENDCGYGTHTGDGTIGTGMDAGVPFVSFDFHTDAPLLSYMEYEGTYDKPIIRLREYGPELYDAKLIGGLSDTPGVLTFVETILMLRPQSPCKGETLTANGTATKRR
jgi:hypothetical protein